MVQVSGGQLITSSGQPIMVQAMSGGQGQTIMQVPVSGTQGLQQVKTLIRILPVAQWPKSDRFHYTAASVSDALFLLVLRSSWCSQGRSNCREGRRCSCRGSRVRPSRSSSSNLRPPLLQDRTRSHIHAFFLQSDYMA